MYTGSDTLGGLSLSKTSDGSMLILSLSLSWCVCVETASMLVNTKGRARECSQMPNPHAICLFYLANKKTKEGSLGSVYCVVFYYYFIDFFL